MIIQVEQQIKKNKEEIMETIITAIISGLCVAIPSILATISTNKRQNDLVLYRINKLEDKVGQHNNLIDRMYKIENRVTIIEDETRDRK